MSYPEHEKMRAVKNESQTIGEFLEWLSEQGILLAKYDGETLFVSYYRIEELLAEYFGIDLNKINNEKDQMLQELRKLNE